jgi:acyl carrier protein
MEKISYSKETLESVRAAVARIKTIELGELGKLGPDDKLELDSIGRITLIAELENTFNIEIMDTEVTPELFESLGRLATLMEKLRR